MYVANKIFKSNQIKHLLQVSMVMQCKPILQYGPMWVVSILYFRFRPSETVLPFNT